jgi:flagellin-like hook-associated protein FlgL
MSSISPIESSLSSKALGAVEEALRLRLDAMMRITSGSKISSAKDAPGSTGVSVNLSARGARLDADRLSLQNAASFLQAQGSAISQLSSIFSEIQGLTLTISQGLSLQDSFLTGTEGDDFRFSRGAQSVLVDQFYQKVDTLWSVANQRMGGVNLFKTQVGGDSFTNLVLADGTSARVTKYDFSSDDQGGSSSADSLSSLVRMSAPGGSGIATLSEWLLYTVYADDGEENRMTSIESALAGMISRNGSELLAVQDAADRMASYSVGNAVSLGRIADSNLAEDMTQYASSNIRLYASMAMAFSLIAGA